MSGAVSSPPKKLGDWVSKDKDTVYQADSDGFVVGYGDDPNVSLGVYTDGINPPITKRTSSRDYGDGEGGFCCPVRKNDYWQVICSGPAVIFWIANT